MELVTPKQIAAVMNLQTPPHFSEADLEQLINRGLPKSTLDVSLNQFSSDASVSKKLRNRIVAPATYKRRKDLLNTDESSQLVRLARIFAMSRRCQDLFAY